MLMVGVDVGRLPTLNTCWLLMFSRGIAMFLNILVCNSIEKSINSRHWYMCNVQALVCIRLIYRDTGVSVPLPLWLLVFLQSSLQ